MILIWIFFQGPHSILRYTWHICAQILDCKPVFIEWVVRHNSARTSCIHARQDPKGVALYGVTPLWKVRAQQSHTEPGQCPRCNLTSFPCPGRFSRQLQQKRLTVTKAATRRHVRYGSPANIPFVICHISAQQDDCNLQFTMLAIYNSNECLHFFSKNGLCRHQSVWHENARPGSF